MKPSKWTTLGQRPKSPSPGWTGLVLAFIFASQTFIAPTDPYPVYMIVLAVLGSAWMLYLGIKARALVAFLFLPAAALFLFPVLGLDGFIEFSTTMFMAHAFIAICFGVAGYTYTATERKPK